jgi:hypothetical protein
MTRSQKEAKLGFDKIVDRYGFFPNFKGTPPRDLFQRRVCVFSVLKTIERKLPGKLYINTANDGRLLIINLVIASALTLDCIYDTATLRYRHQPVLVFS